MRYRRILALCEPEGAELGEAALAAEGYAYEILDQTTFERAPPGRVGLVVYQPAESTVGEREVAALLAAARVRAEVSASERDEAEWRDAWKAYFRPRAIGPFVIVPSWEPYAARPGEVTLDLDPGRAFGTGGHASTRLCLEAIGAIADCRRFLDVGCGSGVLAIACARRWPEATGEAVDVDPEAVDVTVENATKNRVAARIAASLRPIAEVAGAFDLVLANLQADVLEAIGAALAARVAPGGRLVASGILLVQAESVAAALARHGLALEETRDEEGWRALILRKNR